MFSVKWGPIIEFSLIGSFIVALIVVGSIFIVRSLRASYKDVFRYQSKFDIELRKMVNLLSKLNGNHKGLFKDHVNLVIKEIPHHMKRELLELIEEAYAELDKNDESLKYLVETYENLQEMRRVRDSKAIIFNHKIIMFPFNIYARIMHFEKWELYLRQQ